MYHRVAMPINDPSVLKYGYGLGCRTQHGAHDPEAHRDRCSNAEWESTGVEVVADIIVGPPAFSKNEVLFNEDGAIYSKPVL